jgi:hypothetical protein
VGSHFGDEGVSFGEVEVPQLQLPKGSGYLDGEEAPFNLAEDLL